MRSILIVASLISVAFLGLHPAAATTVCTPVNTAERCVDTRLCSGAGFSQPLGNGWAQHHCEGTLILFSTLCVGESRLIVYEPAWQFSLLHCDGIGWTWDGAAWHHCDGVAHSEFVTAGWIASCFGSVDRNPSLTGTPSLNSTGITPLVGEVGSYG